MMEELPNASLAYRLLLQEERHRNLSKLSTLTPEPMALQVQERIYGNTWHGGGQKAGSTNRNKRTNVTYYCDHCHLKGHTMDRCFKLHGYPNKNRSSHKRFATLADSDLSAKNEVENTGLSLKQFNHLCTLLGKQEPSQENTHMEVLDSPSAANIAGTFLLSSFFSKDTWIIDSGASDHMCNSLLHLHNIRNIKGHTHEITIPDGSKVKVSQLGDIQITPQLMLTNVLFVPQFRFNLISVPKLCKDNNVHVLFTNEHCMVQDPLMT